MDIYRVRDALSLMDSTSSERTPMRRDRRKVLRLSCLLGPRQTYDSQVLNLPDEILADVVDLLSDDSPTLASLVLVNSLCRQMARSAQFVHVRLDYGPATQQLLSALNEESSASSPDMLKPSIGACIRRIRMATQGSQGVHYHREAILAVEKAKPQGVKVENEEALRNAVNEKYMEYVSDVTKMIARAMPNLESISWEDHFGIDEDFVRAIRASSVQHLRLYLIPIVDPQIFHALRQSAAWPLRKLRVDIANQGERPQLAYFLEPLIRSCASTLEELRLGCMWSGPEVLDCGRPEFPRLRRFRYGSCARRTGSTRLAPHSFARMLSPSLRELDIHELHPADWPDFRDALVCDETRSTLDTLVLGYVEATNREIFLQVLATQNHVTRLCIYESGPSVVEDTIIPMLCNGGFQWLKTLSLQLDVDDPQHIPEDYAVGRNPLHAGITDSSLRALCSLTALEHLRLRAPGYKGWHCEYLVETLPDDVSRVGGFTRLRSLYFEGNVFYRRAFHARMERIARFHERRPRDLASLVEENRRLRKIWEAGWVELDVPNLNPHDNYFDEREEGIARTDDAGLLTDGTVSDSGPQNGRDGTAESQLVESEAGASAQHERELPAKRGRRAITATDHEWMGYAISSEAHQTAILTLVAEYASLLPNLGLMHFDGAPIDIQHSADGSLENAVVSIGTIECWGVSMLKRIFESCGDELW